MYRANGICPPTLAIASRMMAMRSELSAGEFALHMSQSYRYVRCAAMEEIVGEPNPPTAQRAPAFPKRKGEHGRLGVSTIGSKARQFREAPLPFRGVAGGEAVRRCP